jgi:Mn2+/Fe2+ NRAMP family transporter
MAKKALQVTLGLITSIGGFLEIGSVTTAAQAGAEFRFQLLWAIALGAIGLAFLSEMVGRLAAVSKQTLIDAIRARFGMRFYVIVLVTLGVVSFLLLVAELGGVALAIKLATGVGVPLWALPIAFGSWLLLWRAKFEAIENGLAILGLITVVFAVAAIELHPPWHGVLAGVVPSLPATHTTRYAFLAVSILGASISPYLLVFYSSGAVEDGWNVSYLPLNRFVSGFGMNVGGLLSIAVLVAAGMTLYPATAQVDKVEQVARILTVPMPHWGLALFAAALGFACLGAVADVALALAYMLAQGLGWNWSESEPAERDARFSVTYTVAIGLAAIPLLLGVDPIHLTNITMALSALTLPVCIAPLVLLMNDRTFCAQHRNGWFSNTAVITISFLAFVLSLVAIPLQLLGG